MHHPIPRRSWFLLLPCAVACSSAASSSREDPASTPAVVGETVLDGSTTTSTHVEAGADASASDASDAFDAADAADAASTCLGDEPGEAVCPQTGPCAELCQNVLANYRSGVGRAAAACITALASCTGSTDVIPCVDEATARACPTEGALAYCQGFVARCDPNADDPALGSAISTSGCVAIANGLGTAGRTTFQGCIEDAIQAGTCANDVISCADSIRQ